MRVWRSKSGLGFRRDRASGGKPLDSMKAFTLLERAALRSIFAEHPDLAVGLEQQLADAVVTMRENTGGGFFTTISVSENARPVDGPRVLGHETSANVDGLEHGLGFVLFMEEGKLQLLEGFAWGPENTAPLDLSNLRFDIFKAPLNRID